MDWTLGIDTSTTELGIGLYAGLDPACGVSRYLANSHAEQITGCMQFLLESNGISGREITRAGIVVGPGSFTGLRIGIAFLKGFFFNRTAPVLPVSSLENTARAWIGASGPVVVAFDARRDDVFWARFQRGPDGTLSRETPDALCPAVEFAGGLTAQDTVIVDALGYSRSTLAATVARSGAAVVSGRPLQRGLACAQAAAACPADSPLWSTALEVLPAYMRPSAPEENRT